MTLQEHPFCTCEGSSLSSKAPNSMQILDVLLLSAVFSFSLLSLAVRALEEEHYKPPMLRLAEKKEKKRKPDE